MNGLWERIPSGLSFHNKYTIYNRKAFRKSSSQPSLFIYFLRFLWISCSAELPHCPLPDSYPLTGPTLWPLSPPLTSNTTSGRLSATHVLFSGHTHIHRQTYIHGRLQDRMETCMKATNLIWNWQSSQKTIWGESMSESLPAICLLMLFIFITLGSRLDKCLRILCLSVWESLCFEAQGAYCLGHALSSCLHW